MFQSELSKIFYEDVVDEWLAVNIDPMIDKLGLIVNTASKQIMLGGRPRCLSIAAFQTENMDT